MILWGRKCHFVYCSSSCDSFSAMLKSQLLVELCARIVRHLLFHLLLQVFASNAWEIAIFLARFHQNCQLFMFLDNIAAADVASRLNCQLL